MLLMRFSKKKKKKQKPRELVWWPTCDASPRETEAMVSRLARLTEHQEQPQEVQGREFEEDI